MNDQEFEKFYLDFKQNPSCCVSVIHKLTDKQLFKVLNGFEMTEVQKESQRRSFVYGTTKLSNSEITEELVNEVGDNLSNK